MPRSEPPIALITKEDDAIGKPSRLHQRQPSDFNRNNLHTKVSQVFFCRIEGSRKWVIPELPETKFRPCNGCIWYQLGCNLTVRERNVCNGIIDLLLGQ